jgi:biopolymer transport protein ExbD
MKLRHTRSEEPELNITPLIDVVFLLLIFFMVSTTFKREAEITIELPETVTGQTAPKEKEIEIAIDAEGKFYVNKQRDTLKRAIEKSIGNADKPLFIISADGKAPHQAVMTTLDILQQLGHTHLTFATQKSPEE